MSESSESAAREERRRQQVNKAQHRRRVRNATGKRVFNLPLNVDLVAAALLLTRRDGGRDIADHDVAEQCLTDWVHEMLCGVIDDFVPDESMSKIVRDLKSELRSKMRA